MSDEAALVPVDEQHAIQYLIDLEKAGGIDAVSLTLTDLDMPYERWEDIGRFLGSLDRRTRWYIGDWLNFGEAIFGEEAAQAVEATVADRYDLAERVTGLDHQTLVNIRNVCANIAKTRRRSELGFWIHQEVSALEADEQEQWLARAVDEGLTKSQLRALVRGTEPTEPGEPGDPGNGLRPDEQLREAAKRVYHQAQTADDGSAVIPPEPWASFCAALGEN